MNAKTSPRPRTDEKLKKIGKVLDTNVIKHTVDYTMSNFLGKEFLDRYAKEASEDQITSAYYGILIRRLNEAYWKAPASKGQPYRPLTRDDVGPTVMSNKTGETVGGHVASMIGSHYAKGKEIQKRAEEARRANAAAQMRGTRRPQINPKHRNSLV